MEKRRVKPISTLKGLNEQDIAILYNTLPVRNLQAGEVYYGKNTNQHTIYLVLTGQIRIVDITNGMNAEVAMVSEGYCVRQTLINIALVANVATSIAIVDRRVFDQLSDKIQLFFLKRLNDFHFGYIDKLSRKNKQLTDDIFAMRNHTDTDYSKSELILDIINKIPRLPVSTTTLANKLLEDKISLKEASHMVLRDPSLAATILKTINSPYYHLEKKISDVHHAIVYLGFNAIYQIIMGEGVRKTLSINPNFQDLFFHSVAISHIAFEISQISRIGKATQISTICLLHDFGQNVIVLLKEQNPRLGILIDRIAPDQLGALLLKKWNLPDVVCQSIRFQTYPEFSHPANVPALIRNDVTILYLSHLCCEIFQGRSEDDLPLTFLDEYKRLLKWEDFSLSKIVHELILDAISGKIDRYPLSFRDLMGKYIRTRKMNHV